MKTSKSKCQISMCCMFPIYYDIFRLVYRRIQWGSIANSSKSTEWQGLAKDSGLMVAILAYITFIINLKLMLMWFQSKFLSGSATNINVREVLMLLFISFQTSSSKVWYLIRITYIPAAYEILETCNMIRLLSSMTNLSHSGSDAVCCATGVSK